MQTSEFEAVAALLRDARSILILTGAGISADSGLPTYRGVGGLYEEQHTEDGIPIEEALSGYMLASRPELTWKYLWQIGKACRGAQPNRAHSVIADLEKTKPDVRVVTQNVDGLHRLAGSINLVEVHGNIYDLFCTECGASQSASALLADNMDAPRLPPRCTACHGILRPNVVLFGEFLPPAVMEALSDVSRQSHDIIFSIGTTAVFPYIREPIIRAQGADIPAVEINPTSTSMSNRFRYCLRTGAAEAMERLWQHLSRLT